ncbi:hypothetical protein ACJ72_06130 [Emergomyces africanus]|uniref:Uncharacterized protein n=1 Tax=Emergomyces africanus TaxID=1955775 RepID=A0A1B7NRY7_9EURO|nr:hypothetical protein ACJ72_06130 [Emergomyces africanus]
MPPLKKGLKIPTRAYKPDKLDNAINHVQPPPTTTSKTISRRTTRPEGRRTLSLNKSGSSRQRQHRLALRGNTRSQKTLTQIDFVKRAETFLAGDNEIENGEPDLGYIVEDKWDGDYGVSVRFSKRRKRSGIVKEGSIGNKAGSCIGGWKRADGMEGEDHDRTLTQMGYVIKPSSSYHGRRANRLHAGLDNGKRGVTLEIIGEESDAEMGDGALQETKLQCGDQVSRRSMKRKAPVANAEGYPARSEISSTSSHFGGEASVAVPAVPAPVTPQKPIRLEIPSSQSPDSPDLMLYPWSFKQPPPRFPFAPVSDNLVSKKAPSSALKNECKTPMHISQVAQFEIPESSFNSVGTGSPTRSCVNESALGLETTPATSPPLPEEDSNTTLSTLSHNSPKPAQARKEDQEAEPRDPGTAVHGATKCKKSVIYETDAESEDEELYDSRLDNHDGDDNLHDLPVQHRNSDQEICDKFPGSSPGSEPSMLYYRKPMSLAFDPPSELDNIGTQRLAELFPELEAETQECENPPLATVLNEHEAELVMADDVPTRRAGETSHMDLIPDSSPDSSPRRQSDTTTEHNASPLLSQLVLLVASSQQNNMENADPGCADRIHSESDYQGLVTVSQLLTDSMMESVPGPPMWMSSQYLLQEEEGKGEEAEEE